MAYIRIMEGDALTETLKVLTMLGGTDTVKAVRINTPVNGTPKFTTYPELWPVVLEVTPTTRTMHHITRVCILNMNSGYRGHGPLATQKLMEILGFSESAPDVLKTTFKCERFVKETSV